MVALQVVTSPTPTGAAMQRMVVGSCKTTANGVLDTVDEINADTKLASMTKVAEQYVSPFTVSMNVGAVGSLTLVGILSSKLNS
jgi:hypothetical protein